MNCPRCHSLTVQEIFVDYGSGIGAMSFLGYRCLLCGDVSDATILRHRVSECTPLWGNRRKRRFSICAGRSGDSGGGQRSSR